MAKAKRRAPGEGGVYEYQTAKGTRWYFKCTVTVGTERKPLVRRGFETKGDALKELRKVLGQNDAGTFADPGKLTVSQWLDAWLGMIRVSDGTRGIYWGKVETCLKPKLGAVPLRKLTSAQIDTAYRELEKTGGRYGKSLAASTVRNVHAVLHSALQAAVDAEPPLLAKNPASRAHPPVVESDGKVKAWTPSELDAFLRWADVNEPERAPFWRVLAATGLRRGEALGLEWRDVKGTTLSVERNCAPSGPLGLPKIGPIKTRKPRAVALDDATVKLLKARKAHRGSAALQLARPEAAIFANENGYRPRPKAETEAFGSAVRRCRRDLGEAAPPVITLHGLRHTAITHWLEAGIPVKTVAERHGHSVQVMLGTYAHVLAGSQASAVQTVADLMAQRAARSA